MATTYHIRVICETEAASEGEPGYGEGWHYYRTTQTTKDSTVKDPAHTSATHRDFVTERTEVTE